MKRKPEHILDELLVLQCQAGDEAALNALVRRWQQPLWRRARQLCGSSDAAHDVVQESWLAIMRGIGRLRDPGRFRFWAMGIVRNKSVDHLRRRQRQRRSETGAATLAPTAVSPHPPESAYPVDALRRVLQQFEPERLELLQLYYREEHSVADIARQLDLPVGTVKSRLYHARERIRNSLKERNHEKIER